MSKADHDNKILLSPEYVRLMSNSANRQEEKLKEIEKELNRTTIEGKNNILLVMGDDGKWINTDKWAYKIHIGDLLKNRDSLVENMMQWEYVLSQLMLGNQGKGERLYIGEVKE